MSGTAFVKWRLPSSSAPEHHGHTDKAVIVDHRAYWNYDKILQVRLTIDRNQSLHECELYFEIIQEFASGGNNEKNLLGRIRLNLSEYVDKSDDDEGIVRRYLMQDSKINSTLKVGIAIRQVEGDRNFITPPLKSAMVFGGIAGVVSSEQSEHDELGRLPTINSQNRETTDMQDMYRRTLAASWNSRADDLPADKLIEELFSGGISWADNHDARAEKSVEHQSERLSASGSLGVKQAMLESRLSPPSFERRPRSSSSNHFRNDGKGAEFAPAINHARKAGSIEQQLYDNPKGKVWKNRSTEFELSEFDVREDLRSWEVMDKEASRLLSCRLFPECRGSPLSPSLRRRNVSARFESSASNATGNDATANDATTSPRTPRRSTFIPKGGLKVPLSVGSLGGAAEVVLVRERWVRKERKGRTSPKVEERTNEPEEVTKSDNGSLPYFLEELRKDDEYLDNNVLQNRIESFRSDFQPLDKLTPTEWTTLRETLGSSFTLRQLTDYITKVGKYNRVRIGLDFDHNTDKMGEWTPGTSEFLETELGSRGSVAERVAAAQALKGKYLLAEKILRDCWQLGIIDEVGQRDIHLPAHSLSLLLSSKHFSFEELAGLYEAKIDVTHFLGLVRITGKQEVCDSISEIVHDSLARIRQEDISLPPDNSVTNANAIFTPNFLSWITKTYAVAFENTTQPPDKIFYLVENKQDADNARRVLNLAYHSANARLAPFSTYVSPAEPFWVHDFDPEDNLTWFDKQKKWFRWGLPATHATESNTSETPFFDKHPTRLSNELLKLLRRQRTPSRAGQPPNTGIQESITAAVGSCLFLRKPNSEESTASASKLGQMALPRTFSTDIPRAAPFLRGLQPQPIDEYQKAHRIRLIPSAFNAHVFPQLELEVTAKTTHRAKDDHEPEFVMRSAKAILLESNLDFLLPENGLDLRFTRKLTREILKTPHDGSGSDPSPLESLEECLRDLFTRCTSAESDLPLPPSIQLSLPRQFLPSDAPDSAEYTFLPVSDIRSTRVYRYEFLDHQLNYTFHESGPFNAAENTNMFLNMNMPAAAAGESTLAAQDHAIQESFHTFYNTACALAFELDRARL
ncbi:hypothetical protein BO70DRAFT_297789 [Aspergillus heteromorphus CBS 117.55]|uniref:C2 NT-type domain-containing protein n=1 Tax=Aspergillus heteromorphus CBS 117.55 TaxID=1448321 RepID=A0A317VDG7_9EURO|nr:uncharacterized protein BO70DRAFT_297789 [Aspergillus heteromorphus CBS 117.55]PWY72413.1 hypothetical protein BO70DRAFT_297789 [Aspergillus heteromorphus CBS 117.55]